MKARSAWFCLAAAFALIAVGLFAAVHIPRQAANAADVPAEAPVITNLPVSQISGVTLRMGEDAVGLIPSGTSFEVIGREDIVFDSSKLAALVYTACHLRADRRLSDPEPLSAYGLDAPRAKITLLLPEGDPIRLFFGDTCSVSEQVYMRKENEDAVYLISAENAELLLHSPEDLRQMELFPPDLDLSQLTLTNASGSFTLVQNQNSASGLFEMIFPVSCTPDWAAVNEKVLLPLKELVPDHFIAADASLSDYADEPLCTLSLSDGSQTWVCRFAQGHDGVIYCATDESGNIYSIDSEKTAFLDVAYNDLLGSSLYRRSVSQVSRITLTVENQTYSIEFSGSADTLSSVFCGHSFGATNTQHFYNLLTAIPIAGELTDDASPQAQPMITLTFNLRDGETDILEFLPINTSYCAVSVNGEAQFATYANVPTLIVQVFLKLAEIL